MCVCVFTSVCRCTCMCMWRPDVDVQCLPWSLSTLVIEARSLSWVQSMTVRPVWLASWLWMSSVCLSVSASECWTTSGLPHPHSFLMWGAGEPKFWSSSLWGKCFAHWAISQPPFYTFETKKLSSKHKARNPGCSFVCLLALNRDSLYISSLPWTAYVPLGWPEILASSASVLGLKARVTNLVRIVIFQHQKTKNTNKIWTWCFSKVPARLGAGCEGCSTTLRREDYKLACTPISIRNWQQYEGDPGRSMGLHHSPQVERLWHVELWSLQLWSRNSVFKALCDWWIFKIISTNEAEVIAQTIKCLLQKHADSSKGK